MYVCNNHVTMFLISTMGLISAPYAMTNESARVSRIELELRGGEGGE